MAAYTGEDRVSNDAFREVYLARINKSVTHREIASAMDWWRIQKGRNKASGAPVYHCADTSRIRRALGVITDGGGYYRKTIHYDDALKLMNFFLLDPFEVDM